MEIQKLYRPYTPSRQDEDFLERTFTGHEDLLSDILVSVEDQLHKPTHQHWLLVGPRGIGKSHIIALLRHRVKSNPDLIARWLPIWFPEEAAGIITLRDFMEKVMMLSRDELVKEGSSDSGQRFDEILKATHGEMNDRKAINRIKAFLIDWKDDNQRKIVVLVENADRVLGNRIVKKLLDEKWLRDLLMNTDLFLLIATSPTFFKQVVDRDRPLYELFRIEVIDDLNFDESLDLLIKYAKEENRTDLVKAFETKNNRIKAIHALTGGNPRLLVMLYILIQDSVSNISDVEVGFFNLLEELTPYFQSRMAQLKAQEEKVLVAFAEGPEMLTPAEVGRKIRMATNLVTANLKRLQSAGFIKRIEKPIKGRKGTLYRLSETIYRYWYQMNSERNREMAEIFVRFIVLYYTYSEIRQIYTATSGKTKPVADKDVSGRERQASTELKYLEAAMGVAKTAEIRKFQKLVDKAKEARRSIDEIKKIYKQMIDIDREDLDVLNDYGMYLCTAGELEAGIIYFRKMLALAEKTKEKRYQGGAYNNWGTALLDLARLKEDEGLFKESFEKYALAVKYKEDKHEAYNNWGTALLDLARLKEDEGLFKESFEKYALAVKYKEDKHEAYNNWGTALSDLASLKEDEGLFKQSFEKYALAVKYKEDKHEAYYNWGTALSDLASLKEDEGLFKESFEKYALAVKYKEDKHEAYNNWGIALSDLARLKEDEGLFKESFEKYALAVKYKEDKHGAYYNWGTALSDLASLKEDEGLFKESFEKYALAVKYKEDKHEAYNNWGNALSDLASLKEDEGLFKQSFEKYALAVKYKEDKHEAYYNWGTALSDLASLKEDEGLFKQSFEKYALAWDLIYQLVRLDHPLMVNTALKTVMAASAINSGDEADQTFAELVGALSKVVNLKATIPYFFDFFKLMARQGYTTVAGRYLEQLLNTKFRKQLGPLLPLKFLFRYLDKKDKSIIRRQPPEIQKVLKKMIREIEEGR